MGGYGQEGGVLHCYHTQCHHHHGASGGMAGGQDSPGVRGGKSAFKGGRSGHGVVVDIGPVSSLSINSPSS